jgi:hypothetical protein
MPKGRMLNKKISKDIEVAQLSCRAALLYSWCIPHLDVEGRLEASPEIIKGVVMPYRKDFTLAVIKQCIEEIARVEGLIVYYGNSHKYMQFLGFTKNQTLNKDREAPSEIPAPTPEELKSKSGLSLSKVKLNIREGANALPPPDFITSLKTNLAYKHINIDNELAAMDAWLMVHKGRQKTPRFVVAWLNKIERPLGATETFIPKPKPDCDVCNGTGYVDQDGKKAKCFCW